MQLSHYKHSSLSFMSSRHLRSADIASSIQLDKDIPCPGRCRFWCADVVVANCGKMQLLVCGGWWWQWQSVGLPQLSGDQLAPVETGDTGDWRLLSRVVSGGEGRNCRHYTYSGSSRTIAIFTLLHVLFQPLIAYHNLRRAYNEHLVPQCFSLVLASCNN